LPPKVLSSSLVHVNNLHDAPCCGCVPPPTTHPKTQSVVKRVRIDQFIITWFEGLIPESLVRGTGAKTGGHTTSALHRLLMAKAKGCEAPNATMQWSTRVVVGGLGVPRSSAGSVTSHAAATEGDCDVDGNRSKRARASPARVAPVTSEGGQSTENTHDAKKSRVALPEQDHCRDHDRSRDRDSDRDDLEDRATSAVEALRAKAVKKLRSALHRECSKHGVRPPLLCVERWLFRSSSPADHLHRASSSSSNGNVSGASGASSVSGASDGVSHGGWGGPRVDPVLPSLRGPDPALERDLVRAGIDPAQANLISERMSALAATEVAALTAALPERSAVTKRVVGGEVRFTLGPAERPFVRCNTACYDKLCKLWHAHNATGDALRGHGRAIPVAADGTDFDEATPKNSGDVDVSEAAVEQHMSHDIYCLLTRYDTIAGEGYQAALPALPFEVLQRRLGVTCECFASPLNSTLPRYVI
jgi:hypothetical protein